MICKQSRVFVFVFRERRNAYAEIVDSSYPLVMNSNWNCKHPGHIHPPKSVVFILRSCNGCLIVQYYTHTQGVIQKRNLKTFREPLPPVKVYTHTVTIPS